MANPLAFFKIAFRALKGIFTGEILCQEDIEIGGGLNKVSLLLKRDRRLRSQYVVFVGNRRWYKLY